MAIVTDKKKNALDMRKGHLTHSVTTQETKKEETPGICDAPFLSGISPDLGPWIFC